MTHRKTPSEVALTDIAGAYHAMEDEESGRSARDAIVRYCGECGQQQAFSVRYCGGCGAGMNDSTMANASTIANDPAMSTEDSAVSNADSESLAKRVAGWRRSRKVAVMMLVASVAVVVVVVLVIALPTGGSSIHGGGGSGSGGGTGACLKQDSSFMFWNGMTDSSTWYDWLDTKAGQSFKTRVPATGKVLNVQADWGSHLSSQAYANPNFMKTFDDKIRKWNPKASTQS